MTADLFGKNAQYPFRVQHFDALWAPFLIFQNSAWNIYGGQSDDAGFVSIEQNKY